MKKRILALALTLVMICSLFAGCSQKSAYETIEAAVEKTQTLDAMDVKMVMDMTVSSNVMTMSMPITLEMKAKDMKSENPVILTNLSLSMLGQTIEAQVYQEDGWSYAVMGDMKQKTQAEPETDQYDYSEEMLQVIPEELMQDVKLEKGEDGAAKATISISGEKFMEVYADLVDQLSESLTEADELDVKDAQVVISVKDGYISTYEITFSLEETAGEDVTSLDVKASITYENPGQPVEITPPEGYQDFPES